MNTYIPFEIGDPVLVLDFNYCDGYHIDAKKFGWSLMDSYLNGNVFRTIKEAQIALEEALRKGNKMTIDIPYNIGDPVLVLEFNYHDGYYLDVKKFSWSLMEKYLDGKVFGTIKEAQIALEEANGIHEKS